jgi:hypothetical protein
MSNTTEQQNQNQFKPVTHELINNMLAAIRRINSIHTAEIKRPTDDSELEQATTYLAQNFLAHAGEFLGTWITVANEYEPLVASWASFNARTAGYAAQKQAAATKAAESNQAANKILIPNFVKTKEQQSQDGTIVGDKAPTV